MNAAWASIADLFGTSGQYKIPLFQRQYVWGLAEWKRLWKDIEEKSKLNQGQVQSKRKKHFTGAIVTQALDTPEGEVTKYEIIEVLSLS